MAEINWGILQNHDIGGSFMNALVAGQEFRAKKETRNALADLVTKPDDPAALANLAKYNPEMALTYRKQQGDQRASQQEALMKQAQVQSRLLSGVKDEASWQQALGAARQMGLPLDNIPQAYDPNWVSQSKMIADAFVKDGGQSLTSAAKQVQELGYDINTPEGKSVLAQLINAGHAKPYVDEQGRQRLYTGGNVQPAGAAPQMAPQAGPAPQAGQQAFTPEQFRGLVTGLGRDGAARYLQKHAMPVQIANASDYEMLPEGASYIDPNGISRVKGK